MEPRNAILDRLSAEARAAVLMEGRPFELQAGQILRDVGDELAFAHLPDRGVLAALTFLSDGRCVQTGMIGPEGVTPTYVDDAPRTSRRRFLALTDVAGRRVPLSRLHQLAEDHPSLRETLSAYAVTVARETEDGLACAIHHGAAARLAGLLLRLQDRAGGDQLFITQEALGGLLGVQRTSINEAAQVLQKAGAIRYSRGRITIKDRKGLETAACECYRARPPAATS